MSILAKDIIARAASLAADLGAVHWKTSELVGYLNEAKRQMLADRPDVFAVTSVLPLVAGVRQALPSRATKLLDVLGNASGEPMRQVDRSSLDFSMPGWRSATAASAVRNWTYDLRDPLVFEVYPPATADAQLRVVCATEPTDIEAPGSPTALADAVTGSLPISAAFFSPLVDWVMYRAFSKDGQHPANAARAATYLQSYRQALGLEVEATATVRPRSGKPGGETTE